MEFIRALFRSAWRDALVRVQTAAVGAGGQTGELLITPLGLEPGRRLIIVPHGALHYLPFQALRVDGQYLIQRHPIAIAPSTSIAVKLAARTPSTAPDLVEASHLSFDPRLRSEEHTSEPQSLMRSSYAVLRLKTTNQTHHHTQHP